MKSTLFELQSGLSSAFASADVAFDGVSTDSRRITRGNLFVALRGEHFDAHAFLEQVAAQGAVAVVVERAPVGLDIPALVVPDTRIALGEIARYWRSRLSLPLIGVTGSNGKTTVKEMIAAILTAAFGAERILATRGNLNNEIGVPLTVLRLDAQCQAAVVELAMNHPGEIATLAGVAQPTLALVNNAQREHQEFMASVAAVAEENGSVLKALPADGIAVFPADDEFTPLWRSYANDGGARTIVTFGLSDDADVGCSYVLREFGSELTIQATIRSVTQRFPVRFVVRLAAAGLHNVRNALAAVACTLAIGIAPEAVARGLEAFTPAPGRLQRKTGSSGALVIDDTYNANPDSVRVAIDVLAHLPAPRLLVLGDMGEVGSEGKAFHQEVGTYARAHGIERLLTLGTLAHHSGAAFGTGAEHFDALETLLQALDRELTPTAAVLVKGSRFMKMERVVQHLLGTQEQGLH